MSQKVQHIIRPGSGPLHSARALCNGKVVVQILPGEPKVCRRCTAMQVYRQARREEEWAALAAKTPQLSRE